VVTTTITLKELSTMEVNDSRKDYLSHQEVEEEKVRRCSVLDKQIDEISRKLDKIEKDKGSVSLHVYYMNKLTKALKERAAAW